jgi:hypothetical protein
MTPILAYLWTPVLMALLAVGLGLLVERIARWPLPAALLAPVGAAAAIPLAMTLYHLGLTSLVATPVVVGAALLGFVLARRELRERLRPGWAGAAALLAYLLCVGPSAAMGDWTWAGYNFVNDTSVNMVYVDHLVHHGYTEPGGPFSTTTAMAASGVGQRYPMGAHGLMAALQPLTGVGTAALYQPFLATLIAGTAAAFTQIARRGGAAGPAAAAIAFVAAGANLTYQYSQHGAVKEILMMLLLAAAAAVVAESLITRVRAGVGIVLALCLAATVHVLSVGGAPYALLAAALAVAALMLAPKRPPLRLVGVAALAGAVTALVATVAVIGDVVSYGSGAGSSFEASGEVGVSPVTYGQLLRPLPAYQAAGIWLGEDYRIAVPTGSTQTIQTLLIALMLAAALVGLVGQLRRRAFAAPVLFAACGLTAALVAPRITPYADAKLLVILAPSIVLLAGLGVWELWSRRRRLHAPVAVVVALALGGGVLWSDAVAAHEARFAPTDRMEALEDAAQHAGTGYWLINEWEEYGKFFARSIRSNSGSESDAPDVVVLREPGPIFGQYFDLDEQALEYLQRFDGFIVRRSPVAARPPGEYERVYENAYYELWRRRPDAQRASEHLPLGELYDAGAEPSCSDVRGLARRARRRGEQLVAAPAPQAPVMDVIRQRDRPLGWVPDQNRPGMVTLVTPGRLGGEIRVPEAGTYRVWLQLSSGRPMEVRVDGKLIGSPHQVNTPEQWLALADLPLDAGTHDVELFRRGGRPIPGDGYNGELGPLALEPLGADDSLVRIAPGDAERLCGERWDWIETAPR